MGDWKTFGHVSGLSSCVSAVSFEHSAPPDCRLSSKPPYLERRVPADPSFDPARPGSHLVVHNRFSGQLQLIGLNETRQGVFWPIGGDPHSGFTMMFATLGPDHQTHELIDCTAGDRVI
jgi:hypothetical protein